MHKDQENFLREEVKCSLDIDAISANTLFNSFFKTGFLYEEASRHADFFSLANAKVYVAFLPQLIEGYRQNREDFIIYPVLNALTPKENEADFGIAGEILKSSHPKVLLSILELIEMLEPEPPIPVEEFARIAEFWQQQPNLTPTSQNTPAR